MDKNFITMMWKNTSKTGNGLLTRRKIGSESIKRLCLISLSILRNTLALLQEGARKLREAAIYAQRIDWLFSGDDSEESFKKRIREDLLNSQAEHIRNKPNLHHDPKVDIGYAVDRALEYCFIIDGNKEELKDRILQIMCHLDNIKRNLQKL